MPKYDLSKRIVNGELTRRQMLKGLGAAGVYQLQYLYCQNCIC